MMKKVFLVLLAMLVLSAAFIAEGGAWSLLIGPTVIIPLVLGVLLTTLFSFSFGEIVDTFKDSFAQTAYRERLPNYQKGLLIVKNMGAATMFWSWSVIVMAVILILSKLSTPNKLGPSLAVAFLSLLYGFISRAALFIPMEFSLHQKILSIKDNQTEM